MKLVLSRKGFDAKNGGLASPILPGGILCPLPIPERHSPIRLHQVRFGGSSLASIVEPLTRHKVGANCPVHLDPDLGFESLLRLRGWRPLFGQAGAAQTHLDHHGVAAGDLFLFFGWFRRVERVEGRWCYMREAPDQHVIFGWLQVGDVCKVGKGEELTAFVKRAAWAAYHPHLNGNGWPANNTLYVAARRLSLPGVEVAIPGAGRFERYRPCLSLSAPRNGRSVWRLPPFFYPNQDRRPLSYHRDPARWSSNGKRTTLRSVPIGQEFVLDCDDYPEIWTWLGKLFRSPYLPGRNAQQ